VESADTGSTRAAYNAGGDSPCSFRIGANIPLRRSDASAQRGFRRMVPAGEHEAYWSSAAGPSHLWSSDPKMRAAARGHGVVVATGKTATRMSTRRSGRTPTLRFVVTVEWD